MLCNTRLAVSLFAATALLLLVILGARQSDAPQHYAKKFSSSLTRNDASLNNVHNSTLGFEKIFIIGLPSRTDHRDTNALAAHFTGMEVEYIDAVTNAETKTLPPGGEEMEAGPVRGCWRSHLNAIRTIVERNISSALIMEDDTDWDLRIKNQLEDFARASQLLVQPLAGTKDQFLDPTYHADTETAGGYNGDPPHFDVSPSSRDYKAITKPTSSPYGDIENWDLLWLGHCGHKMPPVAKDLPFIPLGRVPIFDDHTVPEKQHVDMQFGDSQVVDQYPHHTRVVSRARENVCTNAYAVTLPMARRILYELGIKEMQGAIDIEIRDMCDGTRGRDRNVCLSVSPMLFIHHRPRAVKASFSDIGDLKGGVSERAFSRNLRWPVKVNLPKLVKGQTDYIDLFPDGQPRPDLHF